MVQGGTAHDECINGRDFSSLLCFALLWWSWRDDAPELVLFTCITSTVYYTDTSNISLIPHNSIGKSALQPANTIARSCSTEKRSSVPSSSDGEALFDYAGLHRDRGPYDCHWTL